MQLILIANPPLLQLFSGLLVGLLIVAVITDLFLRRKPGLTRRGLLRLCVLILVLGPLAGVGLAGLMILFGNVHPLDRWGLVSALTIVGFVASAIASSLMGVIGTIRIQSRGCPGQHKQKRQDIRPDARGN